MPGEQILPECLESEVDTEVRGRQEELGGGEGCMGCCPHTAGWVMGRGVRCMSRVHGACDSPGDEGWHWAGRGLGSRAGPGYVRFLSPYVTPRVLSPTKAQSPGQVSGVGGGGRICPRQARRAGRVAAGTAGNTSGFESRGLGHDFGLPGALTPGVCFMELKIKVL